MKPSPIILLSDFGLTDGYVGMMKGVILGISPQTLVIDLTHGTPAGDIRGAAIEIWKAHRFFPPGSIFLCVVDPGVGGGRRPVAIRWERYTYVGPDNGLPTYLDHALGQRVIVELTEPQFQRQEPSLTFHGRDLFAPAAAHLSAGISIDALGPVTEDLTGLPIPRLEVGEGPQIIGEILQYDHFGNFLTSIGSLQFEAKDLLLQPWLDQCPPARLPLGGLRVHLPNGASLGLLRTFSDAAPGEVLVYVGSAGFLEIGINQGHAASTLPLQVGQPVNLNYKG